jgi:hypothetical protein
MRHSLRSALIRYRETTLTQRYDGPRDRGILRRKMIDELLRVRPATRDDFMRRIDKHAL